MSVADSDSPVVDDILQHIMNHMPPYEGKDPNTSDKWSCKSSTCCKPEGQSGLRLQVCSRCKAARYCSVACQREDFHKHLPDCREIKQLTSKMEQEAQNLRHNQEWGNGPPSNLFETEIGNFWGILETRDYCRTRFELASRHSNIAHSYEVRPLLEMVLGHQLELLRLCKYDNLGIRDLVPFTLLSLNRDDDCHAFIKHWVPVLRDGSAEYTELHKNSSPGDWIYPRDQNKLEDLWKPGLDSEDFYPLSFLAALCIIKLRIIAAYEAKVEQIKTLSKTGLGKGLGDAMEHVQRLHTNRDGESLEVVQEQEKHVHNYFRILQKRNPTFLPSIVNPGPLKNQAPPDFIQHGKPSEAWGVLNSCNRHFVRIPGVQERIEKIVGKNPKYDYEIQRHF